jgi:KUP system potassium uptake protein
VPGWAVFLTRMEQDAPPVLLWHLKHSRAVQEHLFILTVTFDLVPWVPAQDRLRVTEIAPNVWRGRARFGFMERPDVPALLVRAHGTGCPVNLADLTYFVGHETIVARAEKGGLPGWMVAAFSFLDRNSTHITDHFLLPPDQVVEIGREIAV